LEPFLAIRLIITVWWSEAAMAGHLSSAERYRQQAEQCVAMAKSATSNKLRAEHYAAAERCLKLADLAEKLTDRSTGLRTPLVNALAAPPTDQRPAEV
jgi:hypothetical protein